MIWIKRQPPPHHCQKPLTMFAQIGDIWQCDTCRQQWTVQKNKDGYKIWTRGITGMSPDQ